MRHSLLVFVLLTGCFGGRGSSPQGDDTDTDMKPDAALPQPDAPKPPPPPPLKSYGQPCVNPNECASGLCVGDTGSTFTCSRPCSLQVAMDCKDVDAFCVPISTGGNACYGTIETLNDTDDTIVSVGDSATRSLTPLNDTDVFLVRLNMLGTTTITATPGATIDVRLQAFSMIGEAIGVANNAGPSGAEALQTSVQQIGNHVFIAVSNVGQSTGSYTLTVTNVANAVGGESIPVDAVRLESAEESQ